MAGLAPVEGRRDWYVVERAIFDRHLYGVPGVVFRRDGNVEVHRSHLVLFAPLLESATSALHSSEIFQLRDYQAQGAHFIRSRRGTLLAFQQRLGKTPTTVAAYDPATGPLVVVCPLAVREVWSSWIQRRFPDAKITILKGRDYDRETITGGFVILHYDILPYWRGFANRKIGMLVLDECHLLSNVKSQRTQAAILLGALAKQVVGVTGTPVWNRPSGLFPILSVIVPGAFGRYIDFAERYAAGRPGRHGFVADGVSNTGELRQRLSEISIRKTWAEVAADLPPIERTVELASLSAADEREIDFAAEQAREAGRRKVFAGELARYRRLLGRVKVGAAVESARRFLDAGEGVVVWAWHRDVAQDITAKLSETGPVWCITGKTPQDERARAISAWRAAQPAALVATLAVAGVGVDFSAARHAIMVETDYTPAIVSQGEMRTFSPLRPMSVTYIAADHIVDRKLVEVLCEKCRLGQQVGAAAAETALELLAAAFGMSDPAATPEEGDLTRLMTAWLEEG